MDIDLLSIIKEYWAKIGVDLKIDAKTQAVHTSMRNLGNFEMSIEGYPIAQAWDLTRFRIGQAVNRRGEITSSQLPLALYTEFWRRYFTDRPKAVTAPLSEVLPNVP